MTDRTADAPVSEELRARALAEGRRQLVERGALGLDQTGVADALAVDPAELDRLFPGRHDLLTALIVEAYDAMGDSAERALAEAVESGLEPLQRWIAVARGVRGWSVANPHQYELIYGTTIPGYDAPPETMIAGARTAVALLSVLHQAQSEGALVSRPDDAPPPAPVQTAVRGLSEGMMAGLPDDVIARTLIAWTQLFGMVSFSVFGHIAAFGDDPVAFCDHAADAMGRYVGLQPTAG
ncbi:TetR-like C-terminal domain-containing protein [Streptomyces jumonjinensis]|uniref:TetR-like C-terminal domain-containing protein n=1 Tax=Streptomyces jumonjinensis TaxID=1945 RepID=UPI0018868CB8|nr:TetR-like C-terminal domain-containing protein [Streptomyces jumonjinensis]